jgi:ribosome-binding protein aMBF1 (putative translation factor)
MKKLKFHTSEEVDKELFKDKRVKAAYDALAPEFAVIEGVIRKRLEKKMTQAQLAKKLGTKQSAVARLEGGTYNPTIKFLQKVAKAMDAKLKVTIS